MAEEVIVEEDEFYSIRPLRIRVKPGYDGELPGPNLIEAHVTAIIDLFEQQNSLNGQSRGKEKSTLRTREVTAVIQKYKQRYCGYCC